MYVREGSGHAWSGHWLLSHGSWANKAPSTITSLRTSRRDSRGEGGAGGSAGGAGGAAGGAGGAAADGAASARPVRGLSAGCGRPGGVVIAGESALLHVHSPLVW
jgi:hypothetical protein